MKLYFYRGLKNEKVPDDVTHVIVDSNVTVIRKRAFLNCRHLVSVIMGDSVKRIESDAFDSCFHLVCVIMGNNVKRIKERAFSDCRALRFIRLSKTLEYIGDDAFYHCESLEALFLPSTVKSIGNYAFVWCGSLRLLILPHRIDLDNVKEIISYRTAICQIADNTGVTIEYDENNAIANDESNRRVNEWLFHHMDHAPFHKLCYNSSITTKHLNAYINEHGNDTALDIDTIHGMTPLHMLSMNPHSPADAIAAVLDVDVEVVFRLDGQGKLSLDYARDYNVGGLVALVNGLCNHLQSQKCSMIIHTSKRRRIGL